MGRRTLLASKDAQSFQGSTQGCLSDGHVRSTRVRPTGERMGCEWLPLSMRVTQPPCITPPSHRLHAAGIYLGVCLLTADTTVEAGDQDVRHPARVRGQPGGSPALRTTGECLLALTLVESVWKDLWRTPLHLAVELDLGAGFTSLSRKLPQVAPLVLQMVSPLAAPHTH